MCGQGAIDSSTKGLQGPRQVVTSYQEKSYTVMCGTKFLEKSPKEFLKSLMVQELCSKKPKSRPGGKFTPPLGSMCVNIIVYRTGVT